MLKVALSLTMIALPLEVEAPSADTVRVGNGESRGQQRQDAARKKYEQKRDVSVERGEGNVVQTAYPYIDTTDPANPCVRFRLSPVGVVDDPADFQYPFALCPGVAAPRPTPGEAALYAWSRLTTLPKPTFSLSHQRGVTGDPVHLTPTGPATLRRTFQVYGYNVVLDITSTQTASWGDPRPDPTSATGHASDNADRGAKHTYVDRGTVTIGVRQRWTCHWTAGGEAGVIQDRLTTASTQQLAVDEVQAVLR